MRRLLALCFLAMLARVGAAAPAGGPNGAIECIVPSKPGGAMDLTCKLVRDGLKGLPDQAGRPLRLSYLPGGIGAVAWHSLVSSRRGDANTLVAFSGGSLLNLAQGKFGKARPADVRWVAALGADYGMIAVRSGSPYRTLADLIAALKRHPSRVLIGVSGTIGSQDWLKMALLVRSAGIDPKVLRFVALEGGGEAFTAMQADFVHVVSGDASEAHLMSANGKVRVLAVLSEGRLPGALAGVPTAREQGYDVVWPTIRGIWMGPQASEADYRRWVQTFDRMMATPDFARLRTAAGLYPLSLTGPALTDYVQKAVDDYGKRASQLGLMR
ncbi:C4-dicarboxylate ABC transporter substrate-binding protein [Pseudoduganella plicata]|uniref:C4-dicarboxylate ABC transporter substrate-binding protein n=2 Tax=Pseudoduganella plicata TaxID=321984 RepID=A0A4P7BFN8_9BURK|nr:tripartite tricarboxylate transporter substrate-binding protein [Pseudoduganella plicata]QBQ36385.1 tripartite tricarboxylate transporter substrate binding protein [Pseudoduganella plicata]GGY75648.1 C4-dicarboxylate ABC transporter substrate-binding protein [Pseudoduganella plicata]